MIFLAVVNRDDPLSQWTFVCEYLFASVKSTLHTQHRKQRKWKHTYLSEFFRTPDPHQQLLKGHRGRIEAGTSIISNSKTLNE